MTAVEWLLEHDYLIRSTKWKDIVEQALAMEKEQIINAIKLTIEREYDQQTWANCGSISYMAEVYYQEKYGNSKTPPGAHCEEA